MDIRKHFRLNGNENMSKHGGMQLKQYLGNLEHWALLIGKKKVLQLRTFLSFHLKEREKGEEIPSKF